jgi:hypothetical protein
MYEAGKLTPLRLHEDGRRVIPIDRNGVAGEPMLIRSGCRGFVVPQESKRRLRPVFEPLTNRSTLTEEYPSLRYPPRQQRRHEVAGKRFLLQFDMAAWYDQVAIGCQDHYVCRAKAPVELARADGTTETFGLFALTRVPMGASFSAHTMQNLTWAICEPILAAAAQSTTTAQLWTMIDNVLVGADTEDDFVWAVDAFLRRCEEFGAQLNDLDLMPASTEQLLAQSDMAVPGHEMTFLGEVYANGMVRNAAKNVANLQAAYERLQAALHDNSMTVTRRQVAATIGLTMWMAHLRPI